MAVASAWTRAETKSQTDADDALADALEDADERLPERNMDRLRLALTNFMAEYRDLHGEDVDTRQAAAFVRATGDALTPGALKEAGMIDGDDAN